MAFRKGQKVAIAVNATSKCGTIVVRKGDIRTIKRICSVDSVLSLHNRCKKCGSDMCVVFEEDGLSACFCQIRPLLYTSVGISSELAKDFVLTEERIETKKIKENA